MNEGGSKKEFAPQYSPQIDAFESETGLQTQVDRATKSWHESGIEYQTFTVRTPQLPVNVSAQPAILPNLHLGQLGWKLGARLYMRPGWCI